MKPWRKDAAAHSWAKRMRSTIKRPAHMKTIYTVLRADNSSEVREIDWPHQPGFDLLNKLMTHLLDGGDLEHVSVLHDGKRADMFVDEIGIDKGLPYNHQATQIYQAATLSRHPKADVSELPKIYGTAVIFDRRVWF